MGRSGPAAGVTAADARRAVATIGGPNRPLTAADVADELGADERAVRSALEGLVDDGVLRSRMIAGRRVWWRPEDGREPADESDLEEFGAFVSAVEDYAIFMLDADGHVASWNEGAERIKGYAEEEIVGRHFSTFYTEEDVADDVPERNLERAARDGRVEDEGWRVTADGDRFWANVVITAIRDDDGRLEGFTKVTRDMTERREYEEELRRESRQTEKILRTAPVSLSVTNAAGETVMANHRAEEWLGLSEDGTVGRPDGWTVYNADGEPIPPDETPSARVFETGEAVFNEAVTVEPPEGEPMQFLLNAAPVRGPDGAVQRVVTAGEDVTELRRRERELERRKTELETELGEILGRISDAFYALDADWRFTHLNDRAAEIVRRDPDELLGQSVWEVFPDDVYRERFTEAMETQESVSFEVFVDDLDAWLEFNAYPSETGLSVYFRDVTDRVDRERKLEESNERLEQFAYAASHDLQEPLRMVSSYLQLIERRYGDELDEDGREFLEFAVDGADRMREMIDGLLAYSRVDTRGDPFEPVDLDVVLEDVREDLRVRIDESGATVDVGALPTVDGDPRQLRQLFQNLLDNAIEYAGEGAPRVEVSAERRPGEWVVSVSDDGVGIDAEDQERVFEVFQSLHGRDEHSGTGIGLALCERIVERHGGEIGVESAPGEGSTFWVALPADREDDD